MDSNFRFPEPGKGRARERSRTLRPRRHQQRQRVCLCSEGKQGWGQVASPVVVGSGEDAALHGFGRIAGCCGRSLGC
jgi:hypothetical protein